MVSVQGVVEARPAEGKQWQTVTQGQTYCSDQMIHVRENSRAALELSNETIIRLDQNTTIVLTGESEESSWLDLLKGAVHFITRVPNALKVKTPYVNAAVEGTEFVIRVENGETTVSVIEGRVALENEQGQLLLTDGQSASAREGEAPIRRVDIIPEDAVQWSLYYPSVIDKSHNNPANIAASQPLIIEADQLLAVGRVHEAEALLARIQQQDANNVLAHAMQSIIALTQNRNTAALELATTAFTLNPTSAEAALALSYAQQAQFNLHGAHETLRTALRFSADNSLLLARQAELLLSLGKLEQAEVVARQAIGIDPEQAHALTILGFAHLGQFQVEQAHRYFEQAIRLNQVDPLPRLGHGLAEIRNGKLSDGRREIEIAATLNPANALIRSYLGKAYYEEKRPKLAADQFILAKSLDPKDPTPWFYDAIRKQTLNRPIEALQDLQQSIRLNDNRAIYRSRLLLDQDHAARSASLARIYNDLGFSQLALSEGWKSVNIDPSNHSAHRLLADSYSALPRHEIARVSELLQSQLLQPLNLNPIQPQLAESSLGILDGAGPTSASNNEFNPLFTRNRFSFQMNGIAASQQSDLERNKDHTTRGTDLIHSGLWGRYSYSLGSFHDNNQGIRPNHDRDRDIDNLFIQTALDHNTNLQFEYRDSHTIEGDLPLRYEPTRFSSSKRTSLDTRTVRFGLRHDLAPGNTLLLSALHSSRDESQNNSGAFPQQSIADNRRGHTFELQHLYLQPHYSITTGVGYFNNRNNTNITLDFTPLPCPILSGCLDITQERSKYRNAYLYSQLSSHHSLTWSLGLSLDDVETTRKETLQLNPKLGLTWQPGNQITVRAAAFRALKRNLNNNQTLEPTQVAGFNQFYDDDNATDSRRYGIAIEQQYHSLFAGVELSKRHLDVPFITNNTKTESNWKEQLGRAYLYWTPFNWLAAHTEYRHETFTRPIRSSVDQRDATTGTPALKTQQLPLSANLFFRNGLSLQLSATGVKQNGLFYLTETETTTTSQDSFWLTDAAISYRLNNRTGRITLGAKNLFDKAFRYHNTDIANIRILPERIIFTRLSLSF